MSHDVIGLGRVSARGLRDRMLVLRSLPLFEGVDDDGLVLLAEHARTAAYRAGQVLAPEGQVPRFVQVVTAGEVTRARAGQPPELVPPGTPIGVFALMAREPGSRVVARTDTRTLEIPAAIFEAALDENFSLLRSALRLTGAAVLDSRGNLPADPSIPVLVDEGTYYVEPRSLVERMIELRSGPFGRMNLDALVDMARHMVEVRPRAGEVLWSAGDVSTHALHIDCGRVRCTAEDGRAVEVGRGFTLGVMDLWGVRRRSYQARAETPVIAYRVEFESFLALLETHVEMGLQTLRGLARARGAD